MLAARKRRKGMRILCPQQDCSRRLVFSGTLIRFSSPPPRALIERPSDRGSIDPRRPLANAIVMCSCINRKPSTAPSQRARSASALTLLSSLQYSSLPPRSSPLPLGGVDRSVAVSIVLFHLDLHIGSGGPRTPFHPHIAPLHDNRNDRALRASQERRHRYRQRLVPVTYTHRVVLSHQHQTRQSVDL